MVIGSLTPVVPVRRDVDLATHERLYTGGLGLLIELYRTVHHAVIRQSDGRHVLVLGERNEVPDTTRPVEHRIFRVAVQMRERRYRQIVLPLNAGRPATLPMLGAALACSPILDEQDYRESARVCLHQVKL